MSPTRTTPPKLSAARAAEVTEFAAAVRAALADLPPDELDDLTDGLVGDLTERAMDADEPDLGSPVAYAEELRAAAGYPPRSARTHLGEALPNLRTLPQELLRRWNALLVARPLIASVAKFFVALRPVWWVLRAWVIGMWISNAFFGGWAPLPNGFAGWVLLGAVLVLSVQFGRGKWLPSRWMKRALLVVNIGLVIALPFVLGWAGQAFANMQSAYYYGSYDAGNYYSGQLVGADGTPIDNIYAYDVDGNPIDQVQLYDQNGNPLNLVQDTSVSFWSGSNGETMVVPSGEVPGLAGWNVFPLSHANDWSSYDDDGVISDDEIAAPTFPFTTVKQLAGGADSTPQANVPLTMSPDASADPTPTPIPTP